jgi:DNA mismatch repair protein MutL
VRDLFHNRPARRAQLSGAKAEFARVSELLSRYALCHPDTRFSLRHDDRETFSTPGTGYTDALLGVYDRSVAGQSTTFDAAFDRSADGTGADASNADASVGDSGDADAAVTVEGVLCYPAVTRATRDHVHVAVDGRPVADESLRRAVLAGYGSLLPADRAPVAAVSVRTPPGAVDHNVHPAKAEVAYRDDLPELVERAVGDALTTADLRRSAETAMDLDASLRPVEETSLFADVTVIGQFRGLYLLCAADDELLVVDQHAAHERINYERLRANVGDLPTEPVDPPATLSLSAPTAALVDSLAEELARLGYEATTFGGGTVRVSRVPAPLGRTAAPESLRDALAALDGDAGGDPERVREDLLTEMACHPSLKAGDALSRDEGRALVERLGACDQPYACPHGRPTVLAIDEETLVRGFERGNTRLG